MNSKRSSAKLDSQRKNVSRSNLADKGLKFIESEFLKFWKFLSSINFPLLF